MFSEYRCPACGLYFQTDLDPDEVQLCCLCGYHKPEPVKIVESKTLCSECARQKPASMTMDELEAGIDAALSEVGL
jgi:hypothetical protein